MCVEIHEITELLNGVCDLSSSGDLQRVRIAQDGVKQLFEKKGISLTQDLSLVLDDGVDERDDETVRKIFVSKYFSQLSGIGGFGGLVDPTVVNDPAPVNGLLAGSLINVDNLWNLGRFDQRKFLFHHLCLYVCIYTEFRYKDKYIQVGKFQVSKEKLLGHLALEIWITANAFLFRKKLDSINDGDFSHFSREFLQILVMFSELIPEETEINFPCGLIDHAIYLVFVKRQNGFLLRIDNTGLGVNHHADDAIEPGKKKPFVLGWVALDKLSELQGYIEEVCRIKKDIRNGETTRSKNLKILYDKMTKKRIPQCSLDKLQNVKFHSYDVQKGNWCSFSGFCVGLLCRLEIQSKKIIGEDKGYIEFVRDFFETLRTLEAQGVVAFLPRDSRAHVLQRSYFFVTSMYSDQFSFYRAGGREKLKQLHDLHNGNKKKVAIIYDHDDETVDQFKKLLENFRQDLELIGVETLNCTEVGERGYAGITHCLVLLTSSFVKLLENKGGATGGRYKRVLNGLVTHQVRIKEITLENDIDVISLESHEVRNSWTDKTYAAQFGEIVGFLTSSDRELTHPLAQNSQITKNIAEENVRVLTLPRPTISDTEYEHESEIVTSSFLSASVPPVPEFMRSDSDSMSSETPPSDKSSSDKQDLEPVMADGVPSGPPQERPVELVRPAFSSVRNLFVRPQDPQRGEPQNQAKSDDEHGNEIGVRTEKKRCCVM